MINFIVSLSGLRTQCLAMPNSPCLMKRRRGQKSLTYSRCRHTCRRRPVMLTACLRFGVPAKADKTKCQRLGSPDYSCISRYNWCSLTWLVARLASPVTLVMKGKRIIGLTSTTWLVGGPWQAMTEQGIVWHLEPQLAHFPWNISKKGIVCDVLRGITLRSGLASRAWIFNVIRIRF